MEKLNKRVVEFIEKYANLLDSDITDFQIMARNFLKRSDYTELLLALKSADIDLNEAAIFSPEFDKYSILWIDTTNLDYEFYKTAAEKLKHIDYLPNLKNKTVVDLNLFCNTKVAATPNMSFSDVSNASSFRKLSTKIECKPYINEYSNNIKVMLVLLDDHGNSYYIGNERIIGRLYPDIGWALSEDLFEKCSEQLLDLLKDF